MIEVKFTCQSIEDLNKLLHQLTKDPEPTQYAVQDAPRTHNSCPGDELPRIPGANPKPAENTAGSCEEATEPPTVTVQDLQSMGRKLAANGKGKAVQAILQRHSATLISRIPEAERAAAYKEMEEAQGNG